MEALPAEPAENDLLMIIKMIKKKLRGLSKPSIWGSTAAPYCLKYIIEGSLKKLSTQEINFLCIIILVHTHFTTNIWNTFIFGTWDRNVQKKILQLWWQCNDLTEQNRVKSSEVKTKNNEDMWTNFLWHTKSGYCVYPGWQYAIHKVTKEERNSNN